VRPGRNFAKVVVIVAIERRHICPFFFFGSLLRTRLREMVKGVYS
jgi:hypothetical protein